MSETYKVPIEIHLALTTERIEFLNILPDEEFQKEDLKRLLKDMLSDRVKLRQEVQKHFDALRNLDGLMKATMAKTHWLLNCLDGLEDTDE